MGLVSDEVHIRTDLVYDKHVGFVNLGEVNNHLMRFEGDVVGEEEELQQLANSMVVFMVWALFYNINFPYVQFATLVLIALSYTCYMFISRFILLYYVVVMLLRQRRTAV